MNFFSGKYTGHSTTLYVCCGFQPSAVLLYTEADPAFGFWVSEAGAGNGLTDDGTPTALTTTGISQYTGGDVVATASDAYQDGKANQIAAGLTTAQGFSVGTEADYNTDGETFYFIAFAGDSIATAANASYTNESHN